MQQSRVCIFNMMQYRESHHNAHQYSPAHKETAVLSTGKQESHQADGVHPLLSSIHPLCPLCTRYYSKPVVLNPPKMLQPFQIAPCVVVTCNYKIIFVATS